MGDGDIAHLRQQDRDTIADAHATRDERLRHAIGALAQKPIGDRLEFVAARFQNGDTLGLLFRPAIAGRNAHVEALRYLPFKGADQPIVVADFRQQVGVSSDSRR